MKLESRAAEVLVGRSQRAFDRAVDDTLDVARVIARRNGRTGRFEASLERTADFERDGALVAHIGSPLKSARAKELGAFIQAKNGPYLVFNAGSGVRKVPNVRLKPQPVVTPAGRKFPVLMDARLREQSR